MSHIDSPLTRCSAAALPLIIQAHDVLHSLAAPKASKLADRISALLEEIINVAGDVAAYGNSWVGGDMGKIADSIRLATKDYNDIG